MKRIQRIISVSAVMGLAFAAIASCSPKVDNGGYVQNSDIKSQIMVGQMSRDDVRAKLGSPSSQSSFGDESWYYITSKKEATAFLKPKVTEQKVVRVDFDQAGVVKSVSDYDQNDSAEFALVKRQTPTEGHTLGFVEQIIGNVGRFNKPADGSTVAPGRKPGTGTIR